MAKRKAPPAAPPVPVYLSAIGVRVDFVFPFRWAGKTHRRLTLAPPNLDELEALREIAILGPADVLWAVCGVDASVVGKMKWPDVEAALTAALDLLPPDLADRIRNAGRDADAPAAADPVPAGPGAPFDPLAADGFAPDEAAPQTPDLADFMTSVGDFDRG